MLSGLQLYTSLEALDEAGRGEEAMANARLDLLRGIPLLEINDDVAGLATLVVSKDLVPASAASDAFILPWRQYIGPDFS